MLVVFSPIFMADTKIIFRYDFVAPLTSELYFEFLPKGKHLFFLKNSINCIFSKNVLLLPIGTLCNLKKTVLK